MSYRVAVHATDDVYDRTRARMTMAEEESKKVWYVFYAFCSVDNFTKQF